MNLIRRILSILSIAIILVVIVYGFFWFKTRTEFNQNPEHIIPPDFSIYMRINDFQEFEKSVRMDSPLFQELIETSLIKKSDQFNNLLLDIDSLREVNPPIQDLFTGKILISLHESEENLHLLLTRKTRDQKVTEEWLKILSSNHKINKKKFENKSYYLVEFNGHYLLNKLSFFESNGILAVTTSEELLKNAIRTMNSEEQILQSSKFGRISSTAGSDAIANIFVNYKELNPIIQNLFVNSSLPDLSAIFTSSVLDFELNTENLVINGFTSFQGIPDPKYLDYNDAGKGFALLKNLPFDPILFDIKKGKSIIDTSIEPENDLAKEFLHGFSEQLKDEACFFIMNKKGKLSQVILIDLKSGFTTKEFLVENIAKLTGSDGKPEEEQFNIDNLRYSIYKLAGNTLPKYLSVNPDRGKAYSWFSIYNNVLVLSDTKEAVSEFIYSNMLGTTLNNSEEFKDLSGNFSSSSNRFSYIHTSSYLDILSKYLKPGLAQSIQDSKKSLGKFDAISFQTTRSDDLHYFRIFINYSGELRESVKTVWKRKLDTLSNFKPTIVVNHNNGDKEIMLQDLHHKLYLISSSGNILWKQNLNGNILGEIHQVDYYSNGKLQYLFNTEDKLFLLDRNGNPVERFPITLREKASGGVSILDYDKNGDWRIPVPCIDRKIYMYNKEGNLVSGWKFTSGDYPVLNPLLHKKLGDRDYIIAKEEFQIYFLNRKGKKRIKPEQQIQFSSNPVHFDYGAGNPFVLATDKKGSIYRFYFNEKVEKIMDNNFNEDHHFLAADISGDKKKEYIFIDNGTLLVFNDKKNILFKEDMQENINLPPVIYEFSSNDKKIGVVATKTGEIYLFNENGSQYKGFPLKGSSLYSISAFPGLKDRFNLIVCNKDNFLYNYSVQ